MLTPDQYLSVVTERIQRTGGQLRQVPIGPVTAVVGLWTESVMLSTMNYAVVAAPLPEISAAALHSFTGQASQIARSNVVGSVGWTAASVVIAGLVGTRVYPDAAQVASAKSSNQWGGETRMVAVDLSAGHAHMFIGTKMWGAAMHSSINAKVTFGFPQPAEAEAQFQWQAQQQGGQPQLQQSFPQSGPQPQQPYPQQPQPQQPPYPQQPGHTPPFPGGYRHPPGYQQPGPYGY
ncbi:hypothetical protein [Amycolatopsis suaedae]|uniref:Uncharacterized protein n=1 Tax=Amycolatopsis suaedae TaxID=2510978 RepID=A0A4Q7JB03_9PSEU|nr:hypothetical protein [Amycolatopsis suaedae]RZQ64980.1 hypothetical protein EWH70_03470 [Amycolatopsis suaedae]